MIVMKSIITFVTLATGLLLSGCASYERGLGLDPVGLAPVQSATVDSKGSLVVYSAFDVHADFTSTDPDRHRHTDYRIFSEDGKLLRVVHNDTRSILEGPVEVGLSAGTYQIAARGNGFGVVTLPVVIAPHRITTVHLEGGGSGPNKRAFNQTNAVRLPDGQIVGWRAATEETLGR
jgi:hypothetical protein